MKRGHQLSRGAAESDLNVIVIEYGPLLRIEVTKGGFQIFFGHVTN